MTSIYFMANDVMYGWDAVTEVSPPRSASLSSSPMADGTHQSDNYTVNMRSVTITGIITDIKSANTNNQLSTGNWVDAVDRLIDTKTPVLLKYRQDKEPTSGWFITNFNPGQTKRHGIGAVRSDGSVVQAFTVSMTFSRPILAKGLTTTVQPPAAYLDVLQSKQERAAASQEVDSNTPKGQTVSERLKELKELSIYQDRMANKFGKAALTGTSPEEEETDD